MVAKKLSKDDLVELLLLYVKMYADQQTAGGMFGYRFESQIQDGGDRSANAIARAANLTCGPNILTGVKIARSLREPG